MEGAGGQKILLVEDEALIAAAERAALEKRGYAVTVAATGEAAVAACADGAFDLVLMDIDLGAGMDGTDAALAILRRSDLPIVFLSSHTEPAVVAKTEAITPYGYVVKSAGLPILEASIKMAFKLREAHRKLVEEKVRLASVLDSIGDAVVSADEEGRVSSVNPGAERIFGLRAADAIGGPLAGLLGRAGCAAHFPPAAPGPAFMGAWRAGGAADFAVAAPGGGELRLSASYAPVAVPGKGPAGVGLALRDVTERHRAQEALRQRESYLSAIIENQPGLVWLKDRESRFLAVNAAFLRACGAAPGEDLAGKGDFDVWPAELAGRYRADDRAVLEAGAPRMVEEPIETAGGRAWFETFKAPVFGPGGAVIGTTGYSRDVTARRATEDALELKTLFLEAVANSTADGILVVDLEGRKVLQNARTVELWKIPPEVANDPDGRRQVDHVMAMTRDPGKFVAEIQRQMAAPLECTDDQLELVDGTVLDRHSAPVLGADGTNYGRIYHFHDVTEFKRAEERIRGLLAEKDLILREAHHRVKNYLVSVIGILSLQASSLREGPAAEALREAEGRVQSMALLYDKLYVAASFGSISAANFIPDLVREIVANVPCAAEVAAEAKVDGTELDSKTMRVVGIIVNELITNSLKYAFEGRRTGRIEAGLETRDGTVVVAVADDGVGLPAGGGREAGFGLTLVRLLAQQLEGELEVDHSRGTRFTVRFKP